MAKKDIESKLENYALQLLNCKKAERLRDIILLWILFFISRIFRAITQLRLYLYNGGIIFSRHQFGCIVISVGNLTVGGTGKTPVVEFLSKKLRNEGRHVAILSRGYRSKSKSAFSQWLAALRHGEVEAPPRIVSDGKNVLLNSDVAGDEPYMLARNLPGVCVIVDKDRVKAGKYALRDYGADIMLLDDGFQYLRIKPTYSVVLVDTTRPFHNHHVLPRGLLREPIKQLRRADLIILTKSNHNPQIKHLKKFIKKHNPIAGIVECNHAPKYLENLHTGEQLPLEWLNEKKAASISAIAVPESFEKYLTQLNADLVVRERFIDHHRYTDEEIIEFYQKLEGQQIDVIVTTEKDAVRFPITPTPPCPVLFLRVEITFIDGQEVVEKWLETICFKSSGI